MQSYEVREYRAEDFEHVTLSTERRRSPMARELRGLLLGVLIAWAVFGAAVYAAFAAVRYL